MDATAYDPPAEAGFSLPGVKVMFGDVRDQLRRLPSASVQTCVTSPPYFGLRSYLPDGHPDKPAEIGAEATPEAYVAHMVEVFREVRRVLADDGTLWLNLGDSTRKKNLLMIPARVALALQANGFCLRSEIIWAKPNSMPEPVKDRPTNAHEKVFLLAKRSKYFYDIDVLRKPHAKHRNWPTWEQRKAAGAAMRRGDPSLSGDVCPFRGVGAHPLGGNLRNVWTIPTKPFPDSHFATFPPELPKRCILAGSRPGDTVLDPFAGSGTTGMVARQLGREAVLIDINPANEPLIRERIASVQPALFP